MLASLHRRYRCIRCRWDPITGLAPGATGPRGRPTAGDTAGRVSSATKPELVLSLHCAVAAGTKLNSVPVVVRITAIARIPFDVEFFFMILPSVIGSEIAEENGRAGCYKKSASMLHA